MFVITICEAFIRPNVNFSIKLPFCESIRIMNFSVLIRTCFCLVFWHMVWSAMHNRNTQYFGAISLQHVPCFPWKYSADRSCVLLFCFLFRFDFARLFSLLLLFFSSFPRAKKKWLINAFCGETKVFSVIYQSSKYKSFINKHNRI